VSLQISTRDPAGVTIVGLEGKAALGADSDTLNSSLRELIANGDAQSLAEHRGFDADGQHRDRHNRCRLRQRHASGWALRLLRPRGSVRITLDALKWTDYISTFEDEAQALASFHPHAQSAGG
jgi:hypothetical protein